MTINSIMDYLSWCQIIKLSDKMFKAINMLEDCARKHFSYFLSLKLVLEFWGECADFELFHLVSSSSRAELLDN